MDTNAHLAGAGVDLGQIDDFQRFWASVHHNSYCAHVLRLSS
jgi:hypothetical protein